MVNVDELEKIIASCSEKMSYSQKKRAKRIVNDLRLGADACQLKDLPPIQVPNATSAIENGELLTDKIASWVKCGFVSGPFNFCPLPGFRSFLDGHTKGG